jgi:hypothetical protein
MDNQIIKYKDLFKKLGFDESFISGFIDTVVIDFQYSSHKNLRKKAHHTRNFLLNVFLIFIYLLISNFVYFFFKLIFNRGSKYFVEKSGNIFIPFPDKKYIRFKLIPQILIDDYVLLYPPTFSVKSTYFHLTYFHRNKSNFMLSSFGFYTPFRFLYIALKVRKCLKRMHQNFTKSEISYFNNYLQIPILVAFAYKLYFQQVIDRLSNVKEKKNWFFDFDKDYKYLAFNYVIKNMRKSDNTVHIQHGLFWNDDLCFIKPTTDYIFCCSKREKLLIEQSIDNPNRAIVVGAPLQSFSTHVNSDRISKREKKILVILTVCVYKEVIELQKSVIKYLQDIGESLIIRYRPASRIEDEKVISPIIGRKSNVSRDNTLLQNLLESDLVISFSEDSLLECFRLNKLIYFGSTINPNFLSANLDKEKPFYSFLSINDFKNIFKNQNIDENFSWNGNSFVVDNFGSISIDVVSDNYRKAIETINNI